MYDFANWKPITSAQFVEILAEIAQDPDSGSSLKNELQILKDGSSIRQIFYAQVKAIPSTSSIEPYLALLSSDGQTLCFKRTDVYLA